MNSPIWHLSNNPTCIVRNGDPEDLPPPPGKDYDRSEDQSKVEMNGQEAALLLRYSAGGLYPRDSYVLFPTRYEKPDNCRGYLKAPFKFPYDAVPALTWFDGASLVLEFEDAMAMCFVSPDKPTAWLTIDFTEPERMKPTKSRVLRAVNSHTIRKVERWTSETRLEIAFTCVENDEDVGSSEQDLEERQRLMRLWTEPFKFECPSDAINLAIYFAKIRAAEAVFNAKKIGMVHSPGGGMFYGGVWCNDQAEYAAPLLVLLGEQGSTLRKATLNSFRVLANNFDRDNSTIPYSVEIDGGYIGKLDRGDAAMYAWGLSLVISALNSTEVTDEFFPHVRYCCELMASKISKSVNNVLTSESDELEGIFKTGNANLSVNCIAIMAFEAAAEAAALRGEEQLSKSYREEAIKLRSSAHEYFKVDNPAGYEYHKGCEEARGWICLTALAGLKDGLKALKYSLNNLWSSDGVLVAENDDVIWDRCTLYALRAAFYEGLADEGAARLQQFVESRISEGISAPYAIENNKSLAQLSAESALLVRVVTEGLLGMRYHSGHVLRLRVSCPKEWGHYSVKNIPYAGLHFDCYVKCVNEGIQLQLKSGTIEVTLAGPQGLFVDVTSNNGELAAEVCES